MRRTGPRQLSLAFADSPSGGGAVEPSDESERRNALLHKARSKKTRGPAASAADTSGLLEDVASEANLAEALLNVVRNKGAPGVDGQTVEEAEAKAPSIIARLRRGLLAERYRPGDVRRVWLPKPGGGQRGLGIPNVIDRTVQQAVCQIMEPIFEPTFHPSSHGFRPNRGAHTAIAEATGYLKAGYQTVVDLDLARFFDRVHNQRLLARIAARVKDQRIIRLIRLILTATVVMPDGTRVAVQEGTPRKARSRPCFPISSSTRWIVNWPGGVSGSCGTPMTVISSCAANEPGYGSCLRSDRSWKRECDFRSTRRRVASATPTKFTFWASVSAARRRTMATPLP